MNNGISPSLGDKRRGTLKGSYFIFWDHYLSSVMFINSALEIVIVSGFFP